VGVVVGHKQVPGPLGAIDEGATSSSEDDEGDANQFVVPLRSLNRPTPNPLPRTQPSIVLGLGDFLQMGREATRQVWSRNSQPSLAVQVA
jgi:hypothetical protein